MQIQSKRSRLLAAALALAVNGLLLGGLTLAGRADAEPSAVPANVAAAEAHANPAPEVAKPNENQPAKPAEPKRKPRSGLRKLLPVHDFGGY